MTGTRLGPYEILGPLGSGGMGEVYRARDSRLGRDVAIKVLPAHHAATPEMRSRFEREARAISSLSHPHICMVHDVGHQDGVDYMVMELLAGETLATRIERGPLPATALLRTGIEIAEALDRAHAGGIVHRDLKPGNIMLTKTGAKLMDFGLARLELPETGGLLAGDPGGLASSLTASGEILGTAGYLAPEQVRGQKADHRADLFALGAILFEMATGRRAFPGDSAVATLYAILNQDPPPLASLAPAAPPGLERIVRVCLAKDPEERWQSARDLARELRWVAEDAGAARGGAGRAAARSGRGRLGWVAAGVIAAIAAAVALLAPRPPSGPRVVTAIEPPEGWSIGLHDGPAALSPDGLELAFVATDSAGRSGLWVRPLAAPEARRIAGTDGATCPFWSPDGRSLGFFAGDKLQRVDLASGSPQILADAPWGAGGSWGRDGTILYAGRRGEAILRIAAAGGPPAVAGRPIRAGAFDWQSWPVWLPDGRHFLFYSLTGIGGEGPRDAIYAGSLDRREKPTPVVSGTTFAIPAGRDRILFWREGSLWALPFDAGRLRATGAPVRVAERVARDGDYACGLFAASGAGTLAYQQGGDTGLSELTWADRAGRTIEPVAPPGYFYAPRLSHDGRRLAVYLEGSSFINGDIWIYDLARKVGDRFTLRSAGDIAPVWSAGDDRLFWLSPVGARGPGDIHSKPIATPGGEETLFASGSLAVPHDCTPDGATLLFGYGMPGRGELRVLSLLQRKASTWLATAFEEKQARLSRDGRWIAWMSSETGQPEIYVARFPQGGQKWRVSTGGGESPIWRGDGRELFYVSSARRMMSVSFRAEPAVAIGAPTPLFETDIRPAGDALEPEYDVSADGQRFLLNRLVPARAAKSITLETNWSARR